MQATIYNEVTKITKHNNSVFKSTGIYFINVLIHIFNDRKEKKINGTLNSTEYLISKSPVTL